MEEISLVEQNYQVRYADPDSTVGSSDTGHGHRGHGRVAGRGDTTFGACNDGFRKRVDDKPFLDHPICQERLSLCRRNKS